MHSWLLTLILIHAGGAVERFELTSFASQGECASYGQAWVSQSNKRTDVTDTALFRCTPERS